jgi:hypothetical protein
MHEFFPHVKEVENIGLTNELKKKKTYLVTPRGAALAYCWLLCPLCLYLLAIHLSAAVNWTRLKFDLSMLAAAPAAVKRKKICFWVHQSERMNLELWDA